MHKNLIIKWYKELDSTNLKAIEELNNSSEGTVWIADYQTAGRGQKGNTWESQTSMNLTFTLLLKPFFISPFKQFLISKVASLGVINYLKLRGIEAKIKWPNDIYVNDSKICGMLIEHTICGDKLSASILGIGFNLNQKSFNSDAPNPTSLTNITKIDYDTEAELRELLNSIMSIYRELEEGEEQKINEFYREKLYRLNELNNYIKIDKDAPVNIPVEKIDKGSLIKGEIVGVDEYGCLIIKSISGELSSYAFKEIRYIL